MICSTNSSIRSSAVGGVLALLLLWLSGCAAIGRHEGPPLEFQSLAQEVIGSTPEGFVIIRFAAAGTGGSSGFLYEFRTVKDSVEIIEQVGESPTWDWSPRKPGTYRVKATIRDGAGREVDSDWSAEVVVRSPIGKGSLIALLPVENLSGGRAPLVEIRQRMRWKLSQLGFRLVDDEILEDFMKVYRIRHTGGLQSPVSEALREETGAEAYLVTSLEAYQSMNRPMVSILSRLVMSGERSEILWMDGVGIAGDGYPGFLGLGIIDNLDQLADEAIRCLTDSLDRFLPAQEGTDPVAPTGHYACDARARLVDTPADRKAKRRYRPQLLYRGPSLDSHKRYTLALIPFLNLSDRNNAGKIVALHFVKELIRTGNFTVVEPGILREQLLKYRIIMQAGPSLANAELISADRALGIDLVFSGTTFDYQDAVGIPKVDFTVKIINADNRKMVWSSRSYNTGQEGVYFFDVGRIYTAHRLASEMAWGTYEALARGYGSPKASRTNLHDAEQRPKPSNPGTE